MFDKRELFSICDGLESASRHIREQMKEESTTREALEIMNAIASNYEEVAKKAKELFKDKMKEDKAKAYFDEIVKKDLE